MVRRSRAVAARGSPLTAAAAGDSRPTDAHHPGEVVFYTHTLCPYAHRVSLALAEGRVPHTCVEVDLSRKPEWFTAKGLRLVPALEWPATGEVRKESADLVGLLCERYPGAAERLLPGGSVTWAEAEAALRVCDAGFVSSGMAFLGGGWTVPRTPSRGKTVARTRFERDLDALDRMLEAAGGPYLLGDALSAADVLVWPFAERIELGCRALLDLRMADDDDGEGSPSKWRAVAAWCAAMASRDSVRDLAAPERPLLDAWQRTGRLDFFDYETASVATLREEGKSG